MRSQKCWWLDSLHCILLIEPASTQAYLSRPHHMLNLLSTCTLEPYNKRHMANSNVLSSLELAWDVGFHPISSKRCFHCC